MRAMCTTKAAAEISPGTQSCSGEYPTSSRTRIESCTASNPNTVADPPVGVSKPNRIFSSVLLPAPLGPTSPTIPGSTASVRLSSATTRW